MIVNIKRGNKIINSYEVSDNEVKRRKNNELKSELVAEIVKGDRSVNDIVHVADEVQVKNEPNVESNQESNYKTESKFMSDDKEPELQGNRYGMVQPKTGLELDKEEKTGGEKINERAEALGITPEQLEEAMAAKFQDEVIYTKDENENEERDQQEKDEYEQYRDYETDPREKIKKKINKLEGKM